MIIGDVDSARKVIRAYHHGFYTRLEVLGSLVHAAAKCSPVELAAALPADWIEQIRQCTKEPPASPDKVIIIDPGIKPPGFDYEKHEVNQRLAYFEGSWNWHRFFTPTGAVVLNGSD